MLRTSNDIVLEVASVTAGSNGEVLDLLSIVGWAAQITWDNAGTATASIVAEGSNDRTTWTDLSLSTTLTGSSTAIVEDPTSFYRYLRFRLIVSAGTLNSAKVHFNGKGI